MKNLFFLSSASFAAAFIIQGIITYTWPIPLEVWQSVSNPTADTLGFVTWILGLVGLVAFVIGWWQERK